MARPKSIAWLFLFAFAGLSGNDAQGAPVVVTIGFDVGSPPLFAMKNGCPSGIYPLVVGAIFRDAGQPMIAYPAPFSRVLVKTDAGEWGAGGILKTPERVARYDFSDAIYTEKILVYFNKIKSRPIRALADLEGKRIGVVRGWSYGLNKSINKLQSSGHLSELIRQYLKTSEKTQPGQGLAEPPKNLTAQPGSTNKRSSQSRNMKEQGFKA